MKQILILLYIFSTQVVNAIELTESDKLRSGFIKKSTNKWISELYLENRNDVQITFEFLLDGVVTFMARDENQHRKICSQSYDAILMKFDPSDNVHRVTLLMNNICYSGDKNSTATIKMFVRTKEGEMYTNTSILIVKEK